MAGLIKNNKFSHAESKPWMGNLKKLMTKDPDVKIKILMKCPALTQINADIVNRQRKSTGSAGNICYFYKPIFQIKHGKRREIDFPGHFQGLDSGVYDNCKYSRQLELCLWSIAAFQNGTVVPRPTWSFPFFLFIVGVSMWFSLKKYGHELNGGRIPENIQTNCVNFCTWHLS